jgi:hypothetical protein
MATCAEILRSEFPEIDGQVFDYVTGEPNGINRLGRPKWRSGKRLKDSSVAHRCQASPLRDLLFQVPVGSGPGTGALGH